jgi:predicted transposase/invertase (TIGR01784 family)
MVANNAFILTEMEEKAKAKGKEEGLKEGENKKALEVAKNLLSMGLDILAVIKATGLTEEDVKKIKDNLH